MEIDLNDYDDLKLSQKEACRQAAELLGVTGDEVTDYVENHYQWCRDDEKYAYMGYDSGDCYMGGDFKMGIVCGDYLVIYATCPNYKRLSVRRRKMQGS